MVSPEVVLKAAQMAKPRPSNSNSHWEIWDGSHGKTISYMVFDIDGSISEHEEFNPLTNDSDAWALERALKQRDWVFGYESTNYSAEYVGDGMPQYFYNHCDSMVMLMVVAHLHGLNLNQSEGVSNAS